MIAAMRGGYPVAADVLDREGGRRGILCAMPSTAAGLLLYRSAGDEVKLLLAHMGGPFWARRDQQAWSIIKGEYDAGTEEPLDAARREFTEETGHPAPEGELIPLGSVEQSGGKQVTAWAVQSDLDPATIVSNTFLAEWPPRSGRQEAFPEIDRAEWCDPDLARERLIKAQVAFVERLLTHLAARRESGA
jgi:predicted NUDIX family NTP pyrophosphohydrolase